jgi:hypothetical protein
MTCIRRETRNAEQTKQHIQRESKRTFGTVNRTNEGGTKVTLLMLY